MRVIRCGRWLGLLGGLLLGSTAVPADPKEPETKIQIKVAKYDDLTKTINGLKGKVVLVDFWADT